ncbi:hypothetical protein [Paraclostridium bifermentans]|uniref:hypothetical protein n=1 Tax=Paraclostridium bifermentans TaxID=1490 RepID=UPI00374F8354
MLLINILDDEVLQNAVDRVICGLLPTEGYEHILFGEILNNLFKYIRLEEFEGEYYVLLQMLERINTVKQAVKGYEPKLTRQILEATLESNIESLVASRNVNIRKLLEMEGQDTNIEIEETFDTACSILASRVYDLYDRSLAMNIPSSDSIGFLPALEAEFIIHVANQSIVAQSKIFNEGIKVGRKTFRGPHDWLDFTRITHLEVTQRTAASDNKVITIDSVSKSKELIEKVRANSVPLANYGIPPLDNDTPMLRHRLVIIAAQENVGKTSLSVEWTNNIIMNNHKVLYMTGENTYEKLYTKVLSNYIYQKHGYRITPKDIAQPDGLDENIVRLINVATAEFAELGLMRLAKAFNYETVYEELVAEYDKEPFDAVFIDHSYALLGGGEWYNKIASLALAARNFKNDYPVYIQILSHLSTDAKKSLLSGKQVESSPTKGNAMLSGEADEIFVLSKNALLEKQGLIALQNYKRRDAKVVVENLILKTKFDVSSFVWDDKYQTISNSVAQELVDIGQVYALTEGLYIEDEDDDDEYDDDL